MRFGMLYEHTVTRPWGPDTEYQRYQEALDQVELADKVGIDYVWIVEHHFLEEHAHSSAPEVFLGACSQRTKRIRMGHGIVALPIPYNHPVRVAERISTLDLVSNGRVEFGTGETSSDVELGGFNISRDEKNAMWRESLEVITRMLVEEPFLGYEGKYLQIPVRNVVPKPRQKPHPPLWLACSRLEQIKIAARHGLGALTFGFVSPEEARKWSNEYYRILAEECEPIGAVINPNIAFTALLLCDTNRERAQRLGAENLLFLKYCTDHFYFHGKHEPGKTKLWEMYKNTPGAGTAVEGTSAVITGTPQDAREALRIWRDTGIDQIIVLTQCGNMPHEATCRSIDLLGREVMPEFREEEEKRLREKEARVAPFIERAMKRRKPPRIPRHDGPTIITAVGGYGGIYPGASQDSKP
ncbi:MAG TPA: LLM class flavin-dependent oxidoreductase [Candidatus Binataceae bacterium]|nr:LLM class flavin-dependent oxidoreductase [Candidatus Binataceae bacterium]